jgi:hypothetical protein
MFRENRNEQKRQKKKNEITKNEEDENLNKKEKIMKNAN